MVVFGGFRKGFEDKNSYPSIGEIAYRIGTSHQNAKQIAVKLNEKGFIDLSGIRKTEEY